MVHIIWILNIAHPSPKTTQALPGAWDALAVVVTASTVGSLGFTSCFPRFWFQGLGRDDLFGQILARSPSNWW